MDSVETQRRLDKLASEADTLIIAVDALNVTAARITRRTRRSEAVLAALAVSFLLDILLTVFVYVGLTQLSDTTRVVQDTQANGLVIRQKVLCPLYQLFLNSYSIRVRDNPALNPRGAAWYDNAYATLRDGNKALNCH